ncbi:hypothetical protein ACOSQ2_018898 [Xanthoceras sorbifolium]
MRDAISKVDKEYVKKLEKGNAYLDFLENRGERVMKGEMVTLNFTSLCRFPLYEADFGWVGSASMSLSNLVVFMDTLSGNGIEAWIHLKQDDMDKLEVDEELLAFVFFFFFFFFLRQILAFVN